jgi:GTPase Era involved in 16S rRNA processing
VPKIIISTKCDVPNSEKVVNRANAETITVEAGEPLKLYETSAKDGKNIDTVFKELSKMILESRALNVEQPREANPERV